MKAPWRWLGAWTGKGALGRGIVEAFYEPGDGTPGLPPFVIFRVTRDGQTLTGGMEIADARELGQLLLTLR